MIRKFLQNVSSILQSETESYKRHNAQYEEVGKIELERAAGLVNLETDLINGPEMRVRDLLAEHPTITHAIDVGSGTGWSAAALSALVSKVIAIEPSSAAIEISKSIYPHEEYPNITWMEGFAEQVLPTLDIKEPSLFLTGCVLNHIRDKEVAVICDAISIVAPKGSILSFAENWGDTEWHQLMWHIRTKDWWQAQLPDWELNFHGPEVAEKDEYKGRYHKGIWGVKK